MKRNIRTWFCLVFFAICLAACGGGSSSDGTTPGPTGPKPVVVYSDNAAVCGNAVTVTAQIDPKGSANYHFVLTDNRGGRQVSSTVTINGTGPQLVQASFTGINPTATNTVTVEATNPNGTASDFGSFPTWATPPAITGTAAINITRTSGDIVVTVDPSLDPTMTNVTVRYGTDPTGTIYTQRSRPVPVGLDNLVFSLSGYADNTQVYFWLATNHTWGSWVSETVQSFTTLPWSNTITVTGMFQSTNCIHAIIADGKVVHRVNGDIEPSYTRTLNNVRKVQFILDGGIANPQRVSGVVYDTAMNNVFNFAGDGNINLGAVLMNSIPGGTKLIISGSGYTPTNETARMLNYAWSDIWRITAGDAPLPAPQIGDNVTGSSTYIQDPATPNIVKINVAGFPTITGCMNGSTFYTAGFWWPSNEYVAWGTLNAAGDRIDGWALQSWWDGNVGRQVFISGPFEERR